MRNKIVGSSWKMHVNSITQGTELASSIAQRVGHRDDVDLFFLPPFVLIERIRDIFSDTNILVGAQNCAPIEKGAMTGEVPISLLEEIGCTYIELGHAERKEFFNETDPMVAQKVALCEKYDLTPIVCIGEKQSDIDSGQSEMTLKSQVQWALELVSEPFRKRVILAYEPVWAIGQAESADKDYIDKTHKLLRQIVRDSYSNELADSIRIIYGGSVSPKTASELSTVEDVDGLFIGRFGLSGEGFEAIVNNFMQSNK